MKDELQESLRETVRWLAQHAGFPVMRLTPEAETMLCVAALAAAEEKREQQRFGFQRKDPAQAAALKTHGLRRAQVHFKCDNSAKV